MRADRRARVGLATCADLPEGDEDAPRLEAALAEAGVDVRWVAWDDESVDWAAFDAVVVRSTWDYPARREQFCRWADSVEEATTLANAAAVLRWNTDKRYIADLVAAGVPTVPTAFVAPGDAFVPLGVEQVVKPTVSVGSKDTTRHRPGNSDRPAAHVAALHAEGRTAMVQPYLASVDQRGETALLYLGGSYSHAIAKGPMLPAEGPRSLVGGLYADEHITGREASHAERSVAERALAVVPGGASSLIYARVDVVEDDDGAILVLEVEVTEPSLFLAYAPGAVERFTGAIVRLARRTPGPGGS